MSQIESLIAYEDCRKVFDAATKDPKGARALIGDHGMAQNMRTRMHYFRNLDRKANKLTYPETHALHGTSVYDAYVVRILMDEDRKFWVYVEPRGVVGMVIEGLSEVPEIAGEAEEVLQIEDQT